MSDTNSVTGAKSSTDESAGTQLPDAVNGLTTRQVMVF